MGGRRGSGLWGGPPRQGCRQNPGASGTPTNRAGRQNRQTRLWASEVERLGPGLLSASCGFRLSTDCLWARMAVLAFLTVEATGRGDRPCPLSSFALSAPLPGPL